MLCVMCQGAFGRQLSVPVNRGEPLCRTVKKEPRSAVCASIAVMSTGELAILQNDQVRARTSSATRQVLEQRANPEPRSSRFLPDAPFALLQHLAEAILPQARIGTAVDIADAIDRRLQKGTNAGWRYAVLPPDPQAYLQGLTVFGTMLAQTPLKTFQAMPVPAREGYLHCVANGDVDGPAQFPLSTWLKMVRTDVVRMWVSHPDGMHAMEYFGFADGATGNEGWQAIGPNSPAPFEVESREARGSR